MNEADFAYLKRFLQSRSGVVVSGRREYLIEARLLPLARRAGLSDLDGLIAELRRNPEGAVGIDVVEAMTTGETSFFRDRKPFDHFRDQVLPALLAARTQQHAIRIWCAACSSGQEPYSLALLLREMGRALDGWRIEIVATDLAGAIERARRGVYSQFEVQRGLPIRLLLKYFTRAGEDWEIAPEVRRMVQFRQANLLYDFSALGMFDVIFCRNVMIYFDPITKADLLLRLARTLRADGALLLGGPETTLGLSKAFAPDPAAPMFLRPVAQAKEAARPMLRIVGA